MSDTENWLATATGIVVTSAVLFNVLDVVIFVVFGTKKLVILAGPVLAFLATTTVAVIQMHARLILIYEASFI